jgi:hypothetical protein
MKPGVTAQAYNLNTQETEVGESSIWDHFGLHSKTLSQKNKRNKKGSKPNNNQTKTKNIVLISEYL